MRNGRYDLEGNLQSFYLGTLDEKERHEFLTYVRRNKIHLRAVPFNRRKTDR